MTVALAFAGMLKATGVDSQVYAPSLSSHWPSCMQEAAMWPILFLPPLERGEWHVPSRHVAEAYALAANVPAIRAVFEAVGVPQEWLKDIKVGPTSAFTGPPSLRTPFSVFGQPPLSFLSRPYHGWRHDGAPPPHLGRTRQRTRSPRRQSSLASARTGATGMPSRLGRLGPGEVRGCGARRQYGGD